MNDYDSLFTYKNNNDDENENLGQNYQHDFISRRPKKPMANSNMTTYNLNGNNSNNYTNDLFTYKGEFEEEPESYRHDFITKRPKKPMTNSNVTTFRINNNLPPKYESGKPKDNVVDFRPSGPSKKKQVTNKNMISKSVNKTKLNEKKCKKRKVKLSKAIIITLIIAIIAGSTAKFAYPKIHNHIETEKIKIELVNDFEGELNSMNIDINNLKESIKDLDAEFLKNNLFQFYLISNNDPELMDMITTKAYGCKFSNYLVRNGYFTDTYSSQGTVVGRDASAAKWENAKEAEALWNLQNNNESSHSKGGR